MSLHIQNLQATLENGTEILKGVTLADLLPQPGVDYVI